MLIGTTLHTLVLLAGISGIPWLPHFSLHRPKPAPADTLPPPWKSMSRLSLESRFVLYGLPDLGPAPAGLKVQTDPRRLQVSVDPDSGTISSVAQIGEFPLGPGARMPLALFSQET